jgi:NADH dehydrogenase
VSGKKNKPKVIIIGGGFAGLNAALTLGNKAVEVTLFDKRNFHLFQPLLYQVATGGLSPADISSPLRAILAKQKNTVVLQDEVVDVDPQSKTIQTEKSSYSYDYLIVACGATHHYFGNDSWESIAPGLKTIEDATHIRSKILSAFEKAEISTDQELLKELLTFVIVGGGPTGIEMAGAIGELSQYVLKNDFKNISTAHAKILLIESLNELLPAYPPSLARHAQQSLEKLGIQVIKEARVTKIEPNRVQIKMGKNTRWIKTQTVIWAAGTKASDLAERLAQKTNSEQDKQGRLVVNSFCQLTNTREIFILGDLAHFKDSKQESLPGVAQVAIQQGKYVGKYILRPSRGKAQKVFHYKDKGNMAVIGRKAAVAMVGNIQFSGYFAWILWLFVHLMYLVGFQNKILVFIQWAYNYFTRNSSARIIANYR